MIKGIIFDVDGVLIDTENVHYSAFRELLKKYKYDLSRDGYKKHFSGKSIQGGITSLLQEAKLDHKLPPADFIRVFSQEKIKATIKLFQTKLVFFADTVDFIEHIKKGNICLKKLGQIERNPIIAFTTGLEKVLLDEVLRHHHLKNTVSVLVTAGQYTKSKPDPQCYQLTLGKMKLSAENVVGIEDSPSGIKALNSAGIMSIGITNTHTKEELGEADIIADSLMILLIP